MIDGRDGGTGGGVRVIGIAMFRAGELSLTIDGVLLDVSLI